MKSGAYYTMSTEFRLGGKQYDNCPHQHRSPETAMKCRWWENRGIRNTVIRGREAGVHWTEEEDYGHTF